MMLAYIGIEETKELIEKMQGDKSSDFEEHLDNAINHFFMGEELVKMGFDVAAIQKYNHAWNESYGYLMVKDASSPPNITIEIPANNSYTNSSVQYVSGNVDDVLVFLIENVTISIDGNVSIVPLLNGAFVGEVNLVEGKNTIKISAEDYFDNVGNASVNVTLDTIPPQINITGIEDGAYYNYNVSTKFDISDLHLNTTSLLLDGKPYTLSANISEEGNHTLDVSASDLAGNTATRSVYFTIDKTAPDVNISYPEDAAFVRQLVDIKGDVNDLNLDSTLIKIDGSEVSRSSDYRWDTSGYSDGSHTITLEAVDKAGNSASTSVDVTVDNTLPEVTIRTPLDFYLNQEIIVDADISEANFESLSVRVGGNEVSTTLPYHLDTTLYPDGNHTIEVYAFDKARNIGAEGALVNFDNTAPEINVTFILDGDFVKHAVDIEGSVTDANLISYSINIDGETVSTALPYMWDTFTSSDGNHTIRINAVDRAGNTASKEITVTVDNTLPKVEIKFPPDGAMLKGVVDLTVDVFDTYIDKFRIFINGALVAENESNFSWNTSAYDDGTYIIELAAYDDAGNEKRVSVNVSVDNTVPVIDILSPLDNSFVKGAVSLDANIIESNIASLNVSIDGILISDSVPVEWDSTAYTDGSHTISVYVKDTAGSEASDSVTVTVDNTMPEVAITSPANNSALRGIVDITANVSDTYLSDTSISINGTAVSNTSGYIWDTSTYPDGWYDITVTAVDMARNINRDEVWVEVDNTPPELSVNELTDNPTLEYPEYRIYGTVEPGVVLVINGIAVSHDGTFEYTTTVTEGVNTLNVTVTDTAGNMLNWTKTRLVDTDDLPDYYEINVTGTDPLDGDSDSTKTEVNEGDNGITDDLEDFDNDRVKNILEYAFKSNPFSSDSDNDGLLDAFELVVTWTNLTNPDSDANGILDAYEDFDNDTLVNLDEQNFKTNPYASDTDDDNLNDSQEINVYNTNASKKDTDNDGFEDYDEILLNTDPLNPDTDGDGIIDSKESYAVMTEEESVRVKVTAYGTDGKNVTIRKSTVNSMLNKIPGSIGNAVDINTTSGYSHVRIEMPYDFAKLNGSNETDLKIYYYNETSHMIMPVPVQGVNTEENYVWAEPEHFSIYGLYNYREWILEMKSVDNPTDPTLSAGKETMIKATVHNNEPVLVNNIKVNFYNGNPDSGGILIGSDTIPAITANDYGIASIQWTVTSDVENVYVVVDPANSIQETNEGNNIAYKLIDEKMIDSDGDGLSDYDEVHGIRTNYGVYLTESDNPDSDGDGVDDGNEIGDNKKWNGLISGYYFEINSDPKSVDSDDDGLNDSDEYYYGSDPLNPHSDSDNVNDGDEIKIGTNPMDWDTDGDGTADGVHYVGDMDLIFGELRTLLRDENIEEKSIDEVISNIENYVSKWPPKEFVVYNTPTGFFPKGFPVLWTVDSGKTVSKSKLEIGLKDGFITGSEGEYVWSQTYEMNILLDGVVPKTGGTIKMQPYADINSFRLDGEETETVVIVKEDRKVDIPEGVEVIVIAGAVVYITDKFILVTTTRLIPIQVMLAIIAADNASKVIRAALEDLIGDEVWLVENDGRVYGVA